MECDTFSDCFLLQFAMHLSYCRSPKLNIHRYLFTVTCITYYTQKQSFCFEMLIQFSIVKVWIIFQRPANTQPQYLLYHDWMVSIIVLFILQVHLEFPIVLWHWSSERAAYCIFPPLVIEPSGFSCPLARPAFSHLWLLIWWTLIASLQTCLLWLGPDYDVMCARLCGDPWPMGILGKLA